MKLKEIPRTATFAWSPDQKNPTVVTGTAAGTIDANFDATTELELWNLDLLDHSVAGFTPTPKARVETDSRFHDLAFNRDGSVVVGAFESGVVEAWKAPELKSIGRNGATHSGAVKSVSFSNKELNKFATGGAQGQVFVWDVTNMDQPFAPGTIPAQRHDDVESVAWNHATAQILASGGNKGFASLWDTRRKREVLHLYYTSAAGVRGPISSVQWHPTISTKLATASMDDNEPVICIWDLKNANSPEKVLRGHSKGVLSLDWCRQDEALMLSGGRDNATMLWNPETGVQLGAYPISVEWAFKTQFHPRMPDIFASASFDGKISVQTLQDTHGGTKTSSSAAASAGNDGSDFWESENVMDAVHPSFQLQQAPKWLVSPTSINFGFGGKLVVAKGTEIKIKTVKDSSLNDEVSKGFGSAIKNQNFEELASKKADDSLSWKLLAGLMDGKEVELPESPLSGKEDEDEDDLFDFVPQYAPSAALNLLKSKHPEVVKSVLANQFDSAVSQLIAAGEPADALLIATFGDQSLITRAQNAYLTANADKNAYLRAAWDLKQKKQDDLVLNSELEAWPSVLRSILPSSDSKHLTYLLGKRLVDAGERENALRIYFAGKNVAAIASLWLDELPEIEKKILAEGGVTAYVAHVRALQQVVEKIATVTSKLGVPPITDDGADRLYSALRDYADIASQQGDLALAKLLLDMLPEEFADDKQRVNVATESPKRRPAQPRQVRNQPALANGTPAVPPTQLGVPPISVPPVGATPTGAAASSPTRPTARAGGSIISGKNRYAPNPYAPPSATAPPTDFLATSGASPSPFGVAGAPSLGTPGLSNAAVSAAASVAAPPPPPPAGPATGRPTGGVPFKGWNDIPELPGGSRRTPAAPTRVAPARTVSMTAPPSSSSSSRRGSMSGSTNVPPPPPAVGTAARAQASNATPTMPPPPPVGGAPVVMSPLSAATPPPVSSSPAPRPSNPYAPKQTSTRVPSGTSGKPNQYAPPPSSVNAAASAPPGPIPGPIPSSVRPPSRAGTGPPPRVRPATTATPPLTGGSSFAAPSATPAAPPPAAVAPPPRASSRTSTSSAAPSPAPPAPNAAVAGAALSPEAQAITDAFQAEMERVRPVYEAQYAKLYKDTVKRLQRLHEQLPQLSEPVVASLREISQSFAARDYAKAKSSLEVIITEHSEEAGEWLTGVKRLVNVSEKIPV